MATYRGLIGLALAMSATGCGGAGATLSGAGGTASQASPSSPNAVIPAFSWLRPGPAPSSWHRARLSTGATLAYPTDWRVIKGDPGTASAALLDAHGRFLAYLNLTPRQSNETQANWPAFRVHHNGAEREKDVKVQAVAHGLRFRTGRGTCVRDAYTTSVNVRYVEIACLVNGSRATSVILGAAPSGRWIRERPVIEQAISALTT